MDHSVVINNLMHNINLMLRLRLNMTFELTDEFYVDFAYTKIEFHNTSIHMSRGCHRCKQIRFSYKNIAIIGQACPLSLPIYADFPPQQQGEKTQ